jgi:hypothetical protein
MLGLTSALGCSHGEGPPATRPDNKDTEEKRLAQIETRLARLRSVDLNKIDDDIRDAINREVRQEVELRAAQKRLNDMVKDQAAREERLRSMIQALEKRDPILSFDGVSYKREELAKRLADLTAAFNQQKEAIAQAEAGIKSQQEAQSAIGKDVIALQEEKAKLKAQIADLQRRLESFRREQRTVPLDDKIKRLIDQIEQDIAEAELRFEKYQKHGRDKEPARPAAPEGVNDKDAIENAKKALQ